MSIQCTWLWTWYNDCCLGTFQDVICTYFLIKMLAKRAYLWRVLKNPTRLKKKSFCLKSLNMFWRKWLNGWFKRKKNLRCSWILAWLLLGLVQGHIFRPFPDLQWGGGCRWWHVPGSNFGLEVLSGAFYIFSWKKETFMTLSEIYGVL